MLDISEPWKGYQRYITTSCICLIVRSLSSVVSSISLSFSGNDAFCESFRLCVPTIVLIAYQVICLKAVREMEKGAESKHADYDPDDEETQQLLRRDPYSQKEPYKAAVEDTMILTMKGISAGMQNTG